jgi:uncharacterized protein YjbI with pentapeptide repeats
LVGSDGRRARRFRLLRPFGPVGDGAQSLRRRLHRRADGRLRHAARQTRQRHHVRLRHAGLGPDRRLDASRRSARVQPARRQPDRADLFEADLREGQIAAADRKEGYRIIEPVQREAQAHGAILAGANLERSRLSGIIATKADFSDAILKDAKLVRANLKQANFNGANLAGADLSGANLFGADLRNAVLVGAKTMSWNINDTNMDGALTDKASGKDVSEMPYEQMIADHARWCETGGAEGKPSVFDRADLRNLKSVRGFNLTALSAKGRCSTDWTWKACRCRARSWKAPTCAHAICVGPTCAARGSRAPS